MMSYSSVQGHERGGGALVDLDVEHGQTPAAGK
jgi:hypothetical protein